MTIYRDLKQKSPDWFQLRRGRVCSSDVHRIVDSEGVLRRGRSKSAELSEGVQTYIAQLVSERVSGYVDDSSEYQSQAMGYGIDFEHAARLALGIETNLDFAPIGGILSSCGRWWASSDGVAMHGTGVFKVAEIKIPNPRTQVSYLLDERRLIEEYKPQVCMEILVAEAAGGCLFSYGAGINADRANVLIEISCDDPFIDNLRASLERLDQLVAQAMAHIGADAPLITPPPDTTDQAVRDYFGLDDPIEHIAADIDRSHEQFHQGLAGVAQAVDKIWG